jgi:hypothetical protein
MTNRTVKVLGWGSGTAEITASLDGVNSIFRLRSTLEEKTEITKAFDKHLQLCLHLKSQWIFLELNT